MKTTPTPTEYLNKVLLNWPEFCRTHKNIKESIQEVLAENARLKSELRRQVNVGDKAWYVYTLFNEKVVEEVLITQIILDSAGIAQVSVTKCRNVSCTNVNCTYVFNRRHDTLRHIKFTKEDVDAWLEGGETDGY